MATSTSECLQSMMSTTSSGTLIDVCEVPSVESALLEIAEVNVDSVSG